MRNKAWIHSLAPTKSRLRQYFNTLLRQSYPTLPDRKDNIVHLLLCFSQLSYHYTYTLLHHDHIPLRMVLPITKSRCVTVKNESKSMTTVSLHRQGICCGL